MTIVKDYHVNIYYSERDQGYVADIPDLELYSKPSKTAAEALADIEQAKQQWLASATDEQRLIPEPTYHSDTYNRARVTEPKQQTEAKPLGGEDSCARMHSLSRVCDTRAASARAHAVFLPA